MANLQRILGALMGTGLGGRNRRGPSFGKAALGGGLLGGATGYGMLRGAGLAMLGKLAYDAYRNYEGSKSDKEPQSDGREAGAADGADVGMEDRQALLLIRAMVAAANADGRIDDEERRRIADKLQEAGADADDRALIEREMASPVALDELASHVDGEEEAEQFYLASALAIDADTDAERSYLRFVADRLHIPRNRAEELDRLGA